MADVGAFHWSTEINKAIKTCTVFFIEMLISRCFSTLLVCGTCFTTSFQSWHAIAREFPHWRLSDAHWKYRIWLGFICLSHFRILNLQVEIRLLSQTETEILQNNFPGRQKIHWPILCHLKNALRYNDFYHGFSWLSTSHVPVKYTGFLLSPHCLASSSSRKWSIWCWWGNHFRLRKP